MSGFFITLDSSVNENGSETTHDIRQTMNPPRQMDSNSRYALALVSATTSASWFNILNEFNNRVFNYKVLNVSFSMVVDPGSYTFSSLVAAIHEGMLANGHATLILGEYVYEINFQLNLATNFSTVLISDIDYDVVWDTNMRTFFGFEAGTQLATAEGTLEASPFSGVSELQLACDLVAGQSIENGRSSDVLYSFASNVYSPNEIIVLQPSAVLFVDISKKQDISNIRVYLKDQLGRPLNLQGSKLSVTLYCQKK